MAPPSRQKPWWVEKREHQSEWRLLPPRPASQSPAPLRHLAATTEVRQHDWSKPGGGSTDGAWPNPSSQPIPGQARSSRRHDRVRQRDRSEARRRRHGREGEEPTTGQPVPGMTVAPPPTLSPGRDSGRRSFTGKCATQFSAGGSLVLEIGISRNKEPPTDTGIHTSLPPCVPTYETDGGE